MAPLPLGMPTSRRNKMLLLVLGTGCATGMHLGLLHFVLWRSWTAPITFVLGSLVFAAVTYGLWRWVFPRLGGRTLPAQVTRQVIVAFVIFIALGFLAASVGAWLLGAPSLFGIPAGPEHHITVTPERRQQLARLYALLPVVPTVLITLIAYHLVWRQVEALQSRARELTELAATAQLAALRAQINPHFLFNSLNSIAQLIRSDPDKAEACVERLAEMFRYILNRAEKEFVPLGEELQMTRAYLDIERARFDERLRVRTTIDPKSLRQMIPNLILQPLVENALKHGLSRKVGVGTVSIDAHVDGDTLTLTVGDDGLGMSGPILDDVYHRGVGLSNLRQRLERLYGPAHLPDIESAPGRGTVVRLRLPAVPAEAA
ncbi:MAG: sensor histidine kinase [bacterium]|nr:sensor histidine kinase [bacterium]